MKPPKKASEINHCFGDYNPIIESFGNVLISISDDDYSGDTYAMLESDGKYGYITFGWGSCSGCDALQACDTTEEVDELIEELYSSIKWFDSIAELRYWFASKDWSYCFEWHGDSFKKFYALAIEKLDELIKQNKEN